MSIRLSERELTLILKIIFLIRQFLFFSYDKYMYFYLDMSNVFFIFVEQLIKQNKNGNKNQ